MRIALQEGLTEPDKLVNTRGATHMLNIYVCKYFVKVSHEVKAPPFPQTISEQWYEKHSSSSRLNPNRTEQST